MTERVYGRIANVLMLIGIASALLFDSARVSHAVAGTIGILTGTLAITLYFYNQYKIKVKEGLAERRAVGTAKEGRQKEVVNFRSQKQQSHLDEAAITVLALKNIQNMRRSDRDLRAVQPYRKEAVRTWLSHYAEHHARSLQWEIVGRDAALMRPEVELSPNEVAACAFEIMHNLAMADNDNEWEYIFGPRGLHVKKSHSTRTMTPQDEFDFEPDASMAQ